MPDPDPRTTRLGALRPYTTRLFNPISRRAAGWLPGFGILAYRGRTSGRMYRTPLNVFRRGDAYVVALTYGPDVQWVKNVLAAGEAGLQTRGRHVRLVAPELFDDPMRLVMPQPVRTFLGFMRVRWFLRMTIADER